MDVRPVNKLDLHNATSRLRQLVEEINGISCVRLHSEVQDMEKVAEQVGKGVVGPHFARSLNDIPPGHLMFVAAYSDDDRPVGMVAARYDDKPGWDLRQFLAAHWARLYPAENPGTYAEFAHDSSMYASGLTGPFSYIGDGWINEQFRGMSLLANLQKLLILLAYDEWKPKLTYGWMRPDKVLSGYAARWGYSIVYPCGITWRVPPKQKDLRDVYFVAADNRGIRQLVLNQLQPDIELEQTNSIEETSPRQVS